MPSDLTSWHVSASAVGAGLEAGGDSILVPVGRDFFVDTSVAPQYLVADRPIIQVRGFGTALAADDRVTFSVSSETLDLHVSGLRETAFQAASVQLPRLTAGIHEITVNARTGSGTSVRRHSVTRTIEVVASRLTRTRTDYREITDSTRFEGGRDLTELIVSDAGVGSHLRLLRDLASGGSDRLERALAADVAASLLAEYFPDNGIGLETGSFEGGAYQREDGGIAVVPYASSDLEASALVAIVAPDRFAGSALQGYLRGISESATETRERRNVALAGLAALSVGVLPEIGDALATPDLTVREQLVLGLGAASLGDLTTARSVAVELVARYGEAVGAQARLRLGDDTTASAMGTALLAMLMAAYGDPLAPRYWAYVEADPSATIPFELHGAAFAAWMLEHEVTAPATFGYTIGGTRQVVELGPGETFRLRLTAAQLATLSIEPVSGRVGVTSSWREPVRADSVRGDPDLTITRTVSPSGTIPAGALVTVDLMVEFGAQAPTGCYRVTDQVPSGLVSVGLLQGWTDPETGEMPTGVTYPQEQVGQRVVFCADRSERTGLVLLRYVARVITTGTYRWESAILESRTAAGSGAIVPETVVR
ncbi:MAG: hypothetical protein ACRDIL_08920, partial [Candidatus Limnocylindrales bacterium]